MNGCFRGARTGQPAMERHGPIEAWIIDDTGFAKKGRHSVGVAHQYCSELGQAGNCQVAVTLSIANRHASLPVGYRLYLPKEWAEDRARRKKARIPKEVAFKTKTAIALDLVRAAWAAGIARGVGLMDGAYGCDTELRTGISALGMKYVASIPAAITVWPPGCEPLPPKPYVGHGRRPTRLRRDSTHKPVAVKALALSLPEKAWRKIRWREGSNDWLSSRFARVRIRPALDDYRRQVPHPHEWLLMNGQKVRLSRPATGSPTYRKTSASNAWSILPNCAGASNATTRNLSRRSGFGTMKAAAGGASTTTPRCASPLTDPDRRNATIPPSGPRPAAQRQALAIPEGCRPQAPPIRPERHIPNSIATLRRRLTVAIARNLARCPCCARNNDPFRPLRL